MIQQEKAAYLVLCDLDGTLADISHRQHHVATKPKNWKAFFADLHLDQPVLPLIKLLSFLKRQPEVMVILVTGRDGSYRHTTEAWLKTHHIPYDALLMRRARDFRDDRIVKQELLAYVRSQYGEPDIVFEDRDRVVEMWRANGILCCQVAPGDF